MERAIVIGIGGGSTILLLVVMIWVVIKTEATWRHLLPLYGAWLLYFTLVLGWTMATRFPKEELPRLGARVPIWVAMAAGGVSGLVFGLLTFRAVRWGDALAGSVFALIHWSMVRLSFKLVPPESL
jgi:hypothetical protein